MANTSRIFGFKPVKHVTGAPYNGGGNIYQIPSTDANNTFVGDPVIFDGNASAGGVATVKKAAAGAAVLGVITGFINVKQDPVAGTLTSGSIALDTPQYRVASTAQYCLVEDAPDVVYEVEQTTGGSAYTYLLADVGLNADAYYGGTGSTTTGTSAVSLDMATKAATATLQFKILGTVQRPDNSSVSGTDTAVHVLAKINNSTFGNGTGATGQ
jgi:hypothetical protein